MTYPVPKKIRATQTVHGHLLEDDYAWLREKENPEVRAYLESENRLSEEWLSAHRREVDKVYEELLSRIQETDYSAPEKEGRYYYYLRTVKGGQYPIYCRAESESMEDELVLLDGNAESKGKTFFDIGCIEVSRCDRYLCYGIDEDGSEEYLLQIKDLQSGRLMTEQITCAGTSVEWTEASGFYYTRLSSTKRPYQVYYHKLGTAQEQDTLIYEENDEAYFVDLNRTKDRQFIIIESVSKTTSECRILPCAEMSPEPELFQKR
ncbi:MAG: oligopeptidase B, partial [Candidatus Omnitrophica bacterium]|nr:oligopeptidase B [Candidatus Omnitrophota bacterium]